MQAQPDNPVKAPEEVIPVLMPQAGQSMEEGRIISWMVGVGDRIHVGQVIMEIETDKATMEVEAVDAGRIAKITAAEGDVVPVKTPVAYLAEEGVDVDAYLASTVAPSKTVETSTEIPQAAEKTTIGAVQTAPLSDSGRIKASPAARKKAQQQGVELASIGTGSGPEGRILSSDIEKAETEQGKQKVHSVSRLRKAIAQNLLYSKQNIPHFYIKTTIEAQKLFEVYQQTKQKFKCTINDFVTLACAKAVRQYPAFRSQYKEDEIVEKPAVNIGIAVGTEDGLVVPVIINADKMNLEQLSVKNRQLIETARGGKLEGVGQGIFTITNLGMFGVEEFSAIINPPESAIVAVGAIREGVKVENGGMKATRLMTISLSVDHRIIDGVAAAQFLKTLGELLENPEQLKG